MMENDGKVENTTTSTNNEQDDLKIEHQEGGQSNENDTDVKNEAPITGSSETDDQNLAQAKIENDIQGASATNAVTTDQDDPKPVENEGHRSRRRNLAEIRSIMTYQQMHTIFLRPPEPAFSPYLLDLYLPPELDNGEEEEDFFY